MLKKSIVLILFILLTTVIVISSVSASEINEDITGDCEEIEINENNANEEIEKTNADTSDILSKNDASDEVINDGEWRTFSELQDLFDEAEENSEIDLEYNYYCNDDFDNYAVIIDKNLTINGNEHTLDACEKSGGLAIFNSYVRLNNLYIINGYDEGPGSGLYINSESIGILNGCGFVNNTVGEECGGAIYTLGNILLTDCFFIDNYANSDGAGIYAKNEMTLINNCEFINNDASGNGGAIVTEGTLIIFNSYFDDNDVEGNGGAIYAYYPNEGKSSVSIGDSIFYYNYAKKEGGAVYLDAFTIKNELENEAAISYISNTTFDWNGAGSSTNGHGYGGAIFNFHNLEIIDCNFIKNYVYQGGGAIYMNNGVYYQNGSNTYSQTFSLNIHGNTTFTNNTAERYGGAIKIYADPTPLSKGIKGILNISDNVIFEGNNVSNGNGGALSIIDSDSSINNAIFKNNHATEGGAVEGGVTTNCIFENNSKPETSGTIVNGGKNDSTNSDDKIKPTDGVSYDSISKIPVSFSAAPLYTSYGSGQSFIVQVVNKKTSKPIVGFTVILKVNNGGSYKTVYLTTDIDGIARYKVSALGIGTYTVIVSNEKTDLFTVSDTISKITISKGSYIIKAPAIKKKYKKSGAFKITVKNKAGIAIKGVKLTVKVYTGKKFKTYKLKTNNKGVASMKTKSLKKGKHKVVITAKGSGLYNAGKKTSSIKIT